MHALSYAWKAAKALEDRSAYEHYATWIWQGNVGKVIREPAERIATSTATRATFPTEDPAQQAITYYTNRRHRMNYPKYRREGLPLTSSHIESTIKLMNIRMKVTEKFFRLDTGETILQPCGDSLSLSRPPDHALEPRAEKPNQHQYLPKTNCLTDNPGNPSSIKVSSLVNFPFLREVVTSQ